MFEHRTDREVRKGYFLPKVEIKDCIVLIDGQNFVDQNYQIKYDNIWKIPTGKKNDYTTRCLLGYFDFKEHYKLIETDLLKQEKLDVDPKPIQQTHFIWNLENNATMFFIIEGAKKKNKQIFQKEQFKYYDFILFWCNEF